MANNNQYVVPQARQGLQNLKAQAASQVGIANYETQNKADLPSRVNGSVGGQMVKTMISIAEQQLGGGATFR